MKSVINELENIIPMSQIMCEFHLFSYFLMSQGTEHLISWRMGLGCSWQGKQAVGAGSLGHTGTATAKASRQALKGVWQNLGWFPMDAERLITTIGPSWVTDPHCSELEDLGTLQRETCWQAFSLAKMALQVVLIWEWGWASRTRLWQNITDWAFCDANIHSHSTRVLKVQDQGTERVCLGIQLA